MQFHLTCMSFLRCGRRFWFSLGSVGHNLVGLCSNWKVVYEIKGWGFERITSYLFRAESISCTFCFFGKRTRWESESWERKHSALDDKMHIRGIKKMQNRKSRPQCICFWRLWLKKQYMWRFGGNEGQCLLLPSPVSIHRVIEDQALALPGAAGVLSSALWGALRGAGRCNAAEIYCSRPMHRWI